MNFDTALKALEKVPEKGDKGEFKCPICKTGEIRWWRSGARKHIRIVCSTAGCVVLMQ